MPWKKDYLKNLVAMIQAKGHFDNLDFLALLQVERRLHAEIEDFIHAMIEGSQAHFADGDPTTFSPLVNRRHLADLYALAMVDEAIVQAEQTLIDKFTAAAEIEDHQARSLMEQARERAARLIRDALESPETI